MKTNNTEKNSNISSLINVGFSNCINQSNIYIKLLNNIINTYEKELNSLKQNKPNMFQKKKLESYEKTVNRYEQKIIELYNKIDEEINFINETVKIMKNWEHQLDALPSMTTVIVFFNFSLNSRIDLVTY